MEAELQAFLDQRADHTLDEGRRAVVRNGHQPERAAKTRGCVARNMILSLASKLGESAQQRWRRLRGYRWLDELERGITFIDGVAQYEDSNDHRSAA